MVLSASMSVKLLEISCYMSSSLLKYLGSLIQLSKLMMVVVYINLEMSFCANLLGIIFVPLFLILKALLFLLFFMICIAVLQVDTLVERSCYNWLNLGFIFSISISWLMIFASLVLCVRRTKVVLKSQLGFCNRLRTLPDVLITFLWTLLRSYLSLMVMMRFLQLWIDFLVWLDLCLCRLLQQLLMLLNCSLIIGCVNLVFLARLSVTEM